MNCRGLFRFETANCKHIFAFLFLAKINDFAGTSAHTGSQFYTAAKTEDIAAIFFG